LSDYAGNYLLDKRYTKAEFPLGQKVEEAGRVYKFVKYNDGDGNDNAPVGGLSLHLEDGYIPGSVTCDLDSSTIDVIENKSGGFIQPALRNDEYGWSQVWGPNRKALVLAGTAAVNGKLYPNTAVVGGVTTTGTVEHVAIARKAGTTLGVDEAFITIEAP
jgi:hypothetical protein